METKPTLNDYARDMFGEESRVGDAGDTPLPERELTAPTEEDYRDHRDMWLRLKKGQTNDF